MEFLAPAVFPLDPVVRGIARHSEQVGLEIPGDRHISPFVRDCDKHLLQGIFRFMTGTVNSHQIPQ